MKIHFDDSRWPDPLRGNWRARLACLRLPSGTVIAPVPDQADLIFDLGCGGDLINGPAFHLPAESAAHRFPRRTLAWNGSDQPPGLLPGFYASLDQSLFDPALHQTFPYPLVFNHAIRRADPAEASTLASFTGGITSPLRSRMIARLQDHDGVLIRVTPGIWQTILDSGTDDKAKIGYADDIARSRFVLCPRGNGLGSIRFFETLQAGRVPVLLSDRWVLPAGPDWSACVVR
ncbi:MAG: hypothetical protein RL376_1079, partial [Verrucomicrobiota bacterium]